MEVEDEVELKLKKLMMKPKLKLVLFSTDEIGSRNNISSWGGWLGGWVAGLIWKIMPSDCQIGWVLTSGQRVAILWLLFKQRNSTFCLSGLEA